MSPVVRKWGMRGVAALCIGAALLASGVAWVSLFASAIRHPEIAPLLAEVPEPQSWSVLIQEHGLATFLVLMVVLACISVWRFFKPHLGDVLNEWKTMIRKQGEFADNANSLLIKSVKADEDNAIKIGKTLDLVTEIHGEIVK